MDPNSIWRQPAIKYMDHKNIYFSLYTYLHNLYPMSVQFWSVKLSCHEHKYALCWELSWVGQKRTVRCWSWQFYKCWRYGKGKGRPARNGRVLRTESEWRELYSRFSPFPPIIMNSQQRLLKRNSMKFSSNDLGVRTLEGLSVKPEMSHRGF